MVNQYPQSFSTLADMLYDSHNGPNVGQKIDWTIIFIYASSRTLHNTCTQCIAHSQVSCDVYNPFL